MTFPLITFLIFFAGLTGLIVSSHYFVGGSASLAKLWGMRPGLIGLTVVAFGTSAPEILVSAGAAVEGAPDLGIGNALGSNIANIGLVLGATALFAKLPVYRWMFRLEAPMLFVATLMAIVFLLDYHLSQIEGLILLGCALLFPFVFLLDLGYQKTPAVVEADSMIAEAAVEDIPDLSLAKSWLWFAGGLIVLLISAEILVNAATSIAEFYHVSPLVIGVTIVAIGTSLPELAASLTSAMKGHQEMAIGNIVGSNILNICAVMSLPGIIMPSTLGAEVLYRDVFAMSLLTLALITLIFTKTCFKSGKTGTLSWPSGLLLLSIFIGYYIVIFATETPHT